MNVLLMIAFVLSVILTTTQSLTCVSCTKYAQSKCTPAEKLNCQGGLSLGICGCCKVCARIKGEKCGGLWNWYGTCDDGLECKPKDEMNPGKCVPKNVGV